MPAPPAAVSVPPDLTTALPRLGFEVSAQASEEASAVIAQPPHELFRRLLRDQESEAVHLVALRVLDVFFREAAGRDAAFPGTTAGADEIAAHVSGVRDGLAGQIAALRDGEPGAADAVARQRAPLALLAGCWLDVVSQPATQPSVIVNRLFAQHFVLRGEGHPQRSLSQRRRRKLEDAGIYLPHLAADDFLASAGARPLTALHASFYLALSRLPASFLPELVGVHYAVGALGVDDLLLGMTPALPEAALREILAGYLDLAGPAERERLHLGLRTAIGLERESVATLAELADWHRNQPLEARVAAIVARHARYAGRHHARVRVGGRPLAETFADPGMEVAAFLAEFRESGYLRRTPDGTCRFLQAIKLDGPMFGIFSEQEAQTFRAWIESVWRGDRPPVIVMDHAVSDARAGQLTAALAASAPADVVVAEPGEPGDRELLHRLVNIESYPNTRPAAARRAERLLADAEILFACGAAGRYTDASWFDYSPEALYQRAEQVYADKLVAPYQPLTDIPSRDEVVFLQSTYALGALVDAAWIHRVASAGRDDRPADSALLAIYADEVGCGDLRKNHITLIRRALSSMGIRLPHIRDKAFMQQDDLPDDLYGFALHQLCLALFPDTYFAEILGYNLAIEMFGLGELRLHEIQKLRHHGFDDCYERAHLTIDNLSAGHSRQAADIIVAHLGEVRRSLGDTAVAPEWRRVWRGYASLAYFVEHALLRQVRQAGAATAESDSVDLVL